MFGANEGITDQEVRQAQARIVAIKHWIDSLPQGQIGPGEAAALATLSVQLGEAIKVFQNVFDMLEALE